MTGLPVRSRDDPHKIVNPAASNRMLLQALKRKQSVTGEIDTLDRSIIRTNGVAIEVDADLVAGTIILATAVVIGLATAGHYGMTIDEFNTADYGPKALALYTSGFTHRSHFSTVEFFFLFFRRLFH